MIIETNPDKAATSSDNIRVVEDQEPVEQLFAAQLGQFYDVDMVYGGEAALEAMAPTIEVVLLDRRMSGLSGDSVLERLRARNFELQVVMTSGVDPTLDFLALDCDGYVRKLVDNDRLRAVVERHLRLREHDQGV